MPHRRRLALLALGVVAMFALAVWRLPHSPAGIQDLVKGAGPLAVVAALALWCAATPALISWPLLAAASGLMFGPVLGSAVAIAGATLGAAVAFTLARRLGGAGLGAVGGRAARWTAVVERRGFRAVLCLRAAPAMPGTLVNYAAGLSRIRLRDFTAATFIGVAPRSIAYALLGAAAAHPSALAVALPTVILIAMAVLGIALAASTIREARRVGTTGLEPVTPAL